jgi:hypothetical protein
MAQEATTKKEIIQRSAPICRDALDAIQPHLREMDSAQQNNQLRKFIRHGRKLVRRARAYTRQLDELSPQSDGRTRYRRFVNNTFSALDWLDGSFDALASARGRLARKRAEEAVEDTRIARRAARRFGLRQSCVTFVS